MTTQDNAVSAEPTPRREREVRLLHSLDFEGFGALLRAAGFEIEPAKTKSGRDYYDCREPAFGAGLTFRSNSECTRFQGCLLICREWLSPAAAESAYRELRTRLVHATAGVTSAGCLDLTQRVMFFGGVSDTHLRQQLAFWREEMKEFRRTVAEACARVDAWQLH